MLSPSQAESTLFSMTLVYPTRGSANQHAIASTSTFNAYTEKSLVALPNSF